jgi:hypothetical protein
MKYVDGLLEFDRVYRSIGVSAMVLPNCATLRAVPISSITASGKANRSSLLDPVQNSDFSPGTLFGLVM